MTAAHDNRVDALTEAAVLRSLADQVASPVVAGRKSRKALTGKQRSQWSAITDRVANGTSGEMALLPPDIIAAAWKRQCKFLGIGAGLFGWLLWNWAFPMLLELARLWIESKLTAKVSER